MNYSEVIRRFIKNGEKEIVRSTPQVEEGWVIQPEKLTHLFHFRIFTKYRTYYLSCHKDGQNWTCLSPFGITWRFSTFEDLKKELLD